jgi:hypothetical protein
VNATKGGIAQVDWTVWKNRAGGPNKEALESLTK